MTGEDMPGIIHTSSTTPQVDSLVPVTIQLAVPFLSLVFFPLGFPESVFNGCSSVGVR